MLNRLILSYCGALEAFSYTALSVRLKLMVAFLGGGAMDDGYAYASPIKL